MNDLDTSWFKPENYSSLPELSILEWYKEVQARYAMKVILSHLPDLNNGSEEILAKFVDVIKGADDGGFSPYYGQYFISSLMVIGLRFLTRAIRKDKNA